MFRSIAAPVTLAALVAAVLGLSACSRNQGTQHLAANTPAAQPAPTAQPAPAPAPAAAAPQATELNQQNETQQAAAAQENPGDQPEEDPRQTRADAGLERLAQLPADQQLPGGKWKAGVNYQPLVPAQPTSVGPGKVEVVEVFWLGCPHCYALEPYLQAWLKNKPAYVEFVRVPVMWGPAHRAHAHLFYTLLALNRPDLVSKAFDAIQQQHQMLMGSSDDETLQAQEAFAKANGVAADEYAKAFNSFSVNSNLQRAEQLTQRYHVTGVPLVVVDGKYTTDIGEAGSPDKLFGLVDDLAAAERKH
jgi:protein dithiol oxidoreductase (disulfide-forming)